MLRAFLAQWPFLGSARLLAPLSPAASLSWITVFHGISRRKVILMRKIALFAAALTALVLITVANRRRRSDLDGKRVVGGTS